MSKLNAFAAVRNGRLLIHTINALEDNRKAFYKSALARIPNSGSNTPVKYNLALCALFLGVQTFIAAENNAVDWCQFRGPNGSGVAADDKAALSEFNREKNLLWQIKLPPGHSSPCVFGNKIFLTAFAKDKKELQTICVDRGSGKITWRQGIAVEKIETVHKVSNPATATPVCDGKAVYVYQPSFGLVSYSLDGTELWKKALPMPTLNAGGGSYGSGTSPIVVDDTVIVDMHLQPNSHVLAVRCKDGEVVWKAAEPKFNYGYSTPVSWAEDAQTVIGVLNGGRFTAFNLKDGSERWWVNGLPMQTVATPVVADGMVFLNGTGFLGASENVMTPPSFDDVLAKYDTNKDNLIAVEELPGSFLYADRQTTSGTGSMSVQMFLRFFLGKPKTATMDRADWEKQRKEMKEFAASDSMKTAVCGIMLGGKGEKKPAWAESKGVPEVPSPLLYRKRLYLVKSGGVVTCREPATGKLLFEERLDSPGGYFSSPVASGGKIYVAADTGKVTVFEATDTLKVVARNDLGEPIFATPAIVDGKLYIRTAGHLYAFGEK